MSAYTAFIAFVLIVCVLIGIGAVLEVISERRDR